MAKPVFTKLTLSYPDMATNQHPCDGPWPNQCSIRMSIAFNGEGSIQVNAGTYAEPKCKHGHARGAQSLAIWLCNKIGTPKIFKNKVEGKIEIMRKTGIIFFKDCFQRKGETARNGDHIDLWERGITKGYDDINNLATEFWFWELL